MNDDAKSVDEFFAPYEDLAVAIIDDERPNTQIGLNIGNADMAEIVCNLMDWECFDLFEEMDFQTIYDKGSAKQVVAYCYLAFLRWELWLSAIQLNVGDQKFNEKAAAHSELWFLRFRDRYRALALGEMTDHPWMN